MPLNPQIPLSVVLPEPPRHPLAVMADVMKLRDDEAKYKEAARLRQEADQIRQAYKQIGVAPEQREELLGAVANINPMVAEQLRRNYADEEYNLARASAATTEANRRKMDSARETATQLAPYFEVIVETMATPEGWDRGLGLLHGIGRVYDAASSGTGLEGASQMLQSVPRQFSPDAHAQLLKTARLVSQISRVNKSPQSANAFQLIVERMQAAHPETPLSVEELAEAVKLSQGTKSPVDMTPQPMMVTDPDGKQRPAFGVYGGDPAKGMLEVKGGTPIGSGQTKSIEDTEQELREMLQPTVGPDGKAQPSPLVSQAIKGLIDPNRVVSSNRWNPLGLAIFKAAILEADPGWNENRYAVRRAYTDGTKMPSRNIVALNTASAHMGLLVDLAKELKNGDIQRVNAVVNRVRTELGRPDVLNYEMAASAVGSEVAAALKGANAAPTDPEIDNWNGKMASARSPEQIMSGAMTLAKILEGRFGGLQSQWQQTFGKNDFFPIVDDYAQQQFDKIGVSTDRIMGRNREGAVAAGGTPTPGAMQYGVTKRDGTWWPMPSKEAMESAVAESQGQLTAAPKAESVSTLPPASNWGDNPFVTKKK